MLIITTKVNRGIIFLRLYGSLNKKTIKDFLDEVNYLLYDQGTKNFVINFDEVKVSCSEIISYISSKLVEIFLSCGEVVLCGLGSNYQKFIGSRRDRLFFVDDEIDAYKYLVI